MFAFFNRKYLKSLKEWPSIFNLLSSACSVTLNFTSSLNNIPSSVVGFVVFLLAQGQFSYSNRQLREEVTEYETKLTKKLEETLADKQQANNQVKSYKPKGLYELGLDRSTKCVSYTFIIANLLTAATATSLAIAADYTKSSEESGYCKTPLCLTSYGINALAFILMVSEQHIKITNLKDYLALLKYHTDTPTSEQKLGVITNTENANQYSLNDDIKQITFHS